MKKFKKYNIIQNKIINYKIKKKKKKKKYFCLYKNIINIIFIKKI